MEFDELLITTGVDALVRLVKEKQRIELEDASSILNIPPESLEDWARVLEEEGIVRIEYRLTKIYLLWIKPTEEEIATETDSFYEEKEDIQKQVEEFRKNMSERQNDLSSLQASFTQFYDKTYSKMQELEKVVAPLPAGELISQGAFSRGEAELAEIRNQLKEAKNSLSDIRNEVNELGIKGTSPSKEWLDKIEALHQELGGYQGQMDELRKMAEGQKPSDIDMPSVRDIKKKFESLKKDFSALRARNAGLREDMVSLHESSQILHDVAESIMGQEDRLNQMREEVAAVSREADELLRKSTSVSEKVKQDVEIVERLGDSVTVAKGILKRFPSQEKVMEELDGLKKSEDELAGKYESMEALMAEVGGKQLTGKQFTELAKKMDQKIAETRRDMDSLEAALEDEKGTYLTFQKIKERIVPSISTYEKQLEGMEARIAEIGKEAAAQKDNLQNDAKKLQDSLKKGQMQGIMKVAEEVRDKKKMLDEIKNSLNDLVSLSDNLNKRVTLLSREAKLLQIRSGGGAPPAAEVSEKKKELRNQVKLTADEEMEFRKKREELKKLIKRLWDE
jgi:chromosome segregation ATPase